MKRARSRPGDALFLQLYQRAQSALRSGVRADRLPLEEWLGDWIDPRMWLKDFSSNGRGWGVVLTDDVEQGELLLVERAAVAGRGPQFPEELRSLVRDAMCKWEAVPAHQRRQLHQIGNLFDGQHRPVTDALRGLFFDTTWQDADTTLVEARPDGLSEERFFRIAQLNAYESQSLLNSSDQDRAGSTEPETWEWAGLFPVLSLMNHSCEMNTARTYVEDVVFVRAARFLPAGTEVLSNYTSLLAPVASRQQALKKYGFSCSCAWCATESSFASCTGAAATKAREETKKLENLTLAASTASRESCRSAVTELREQLWIMEASVKEALCELQRSLGSTGLSSAITPHHLLLLPRVNALRVISTRSYVFRQWPEVDDARTRLCEIVERILPYGVDHVSWALVWLVCSQRYPTLAGEREVRKAVRNVVRTAIGHEIQVWCALLAANDMKPNEQEKNEQEEKNENVERLEVEDASACASKTPEGTTHKQDVIEECSATGRSHPHVVHWCLPICAFDVPSAIVTVVVNTQPGPSLTLAELIVDVSQDCFTVCRHGVQLAGEVPMRVSFPAKVDTGSANISWSVRRQRLSFKAMALSAAGAPSDG